MISLVFHRKDGVVTRTVEFASFDEWVYADPNEADCREDEEYVQMIGPGKEGENE